jgi:hypothetical protein
MKQIPENNVEILPEEDNNVNLKLDPILVRNGIKIPKNPYINN